MSAKLWNAAPWVNPKGPAHAIWPGVKRNEEERVARSEAARRKVDEAPSADGRRKRSDDSRQRIVTAMLELAREGDVAPSAESVAERAGVGRRTVFRRFKEMDTLYSEMHAAVLERIEDIKRMPINGANWRERLDHLIDRRVRLFEEIMPLKAAGDIHRYRSPFLQKTHAETVRTLRDMLLFVLPKQIKDDPVQLEAFDALLSIETWRRLREEQGLSPKAAAKVLRHMIAALAG